MMLLERLRALGAEKKVQQKVAFFFSFGGFQTRDPNKLGKYMC